jgi:hypothetical protein
MPRWVHALTIALALALGSLLPSAVGGVEAALNSNTFMYSWYHTDQLLYYANRMRAEGEPEAAAVVERCAAEIKAALLAARY